MAKLDDLKIEAKGLGIEVKSKATIAELEKLIADKKNEVNTSSDAENEATTETTEVQEPTFTGEVTEPETKIETETTETETTETVETETETETETIEPEIVEDDEPKVNKDGLIAGKPLTDVEYREYMAKQNTKRIK